MTKKGNGNKEHKKRGSRKGKKDKINGSLAELDVIIEQDLRKKSQHQFKDFLKANARASANNEHSEMINNY